MTDLHTRLRSAIELKLMLAENATPGPWEYAVVEGRGYIGRADTLPSVAEVEFDTDLHFMLAFAPDFAIRACRADLARLERHAPYERAPGDPTLVCEACLIEGEDYDDYGHYDEWPCPEVRSLTEVWLENA